MVEFDGMKCCGNCDNREAMVANHVSMEKCSHHDGETMKSNECCFYWSNWDYSQKNGDYK